MAEKTYLDHEGLTYFWGKIKSYVGDNASTGLKEIETKGNTSILDDYHTDADKMGLYKLTYDGETIGYMMVSSDSMSHGTDQVVFSNMAAPIGSTTTDLLAGGHQDGAFNIVHRYYNKNASTITDPAVGEWSAWTNVAGSTWNEALTEAITSLQTSIADVPTSSISTTEIDTICA